MAATVAKTLHDVWGKRRVKTLLVDDFADADVITVTGMRRVESVVGVVYREVPDAADAVGVETRTEVSSLDPNQIRLQLVGTARKIAITVAGH